MSGWRTALPLATVLAWAFASPARATEPTEDGGPAAALTVDPFGGALSEAGRSGERMDEAAYRGRVPNTTTEALADLPGVFVLQNQRGGGAPVIRGQLGARNLLMVDGVRFATSTFSDGTHPYLAAFDPFSVAGVELLRGPGRVSLGSDALGGVVQLLTRNPTARQRQTWNTGLTTRFSLADTSLGGNYWVDGGGEGFSALASVKYRSYGDLRSGAGITQPLTAYTQGGGTLKTRVDLPGRWALDGAIFDNRTWEAPRTDRIGQGDIRYTTISDQLAYLRLSGPAGPLVEEVSLAVSYHRLDEQIDRTRCATGPSGLVGDIEGCAEELPELVTQRLRRTHVVNQIGGQGSARLALFQRRLQLTFGGGIWLDEVDARAFETRDEAGLDFETLRRGAYGDGSSYLNAGLYLEGDGAIVEVGDWRLRGSAGVRLNLASATAPDTEGFEGNDPNYLGATGTAGLRAHYRDLFTLFASYAQGFRAPNLHELSYVGDSGARYLIPNADLDSERAHSIEVGARFAREKIAAELSAWTTLYDRYIDEVRATAEDPTTQSSVDAIGGKPVMQRVNSEGATFRGVDAAISVGPYRNLSVDGALSWTWGEVERAGGNVPARRVPPVVARAGFTYRLWKGDFFVNPFVRWAGAQDRLHPSDALDLRICQDPGIPGALNDACEGTDSWFTLNVRAGYAIDDRLRLSVAASNLTDERYRTHGSALDAPGYDLRVGVDVSW